VKKHFVHENASLVPEHMKGVNTGNLIKVSYKVDITAV